MANQRMTGKREELNAIWTQVNAVIADATAIRTALLAGLDRGNNQVIGRDQLAAITTDLGSQWVSLYAAVADLATLATRYDHGVVDWPNVDDGSTAGKIKTTATAAYRIAGALYQKAATDDLWDLSGETDTAADKYRAYYLYLDAAGTASFAVGTDEDTADDAIAALPSVGATKGVIGVYVAGLACDFDDAGGLAAQGTLYNGWPSRASLGAPYPNAVTTSTTVTIANGSTAGTLKTRADTEYTIAGQLYRKAATDDLWDLSGETDTAADEYRAYWLYLNAAGTASIAAGTEAASAAAAIAALPAEDAAKCPIGVFVAGLSCDFDAGGGLAAQGTIYDGRPAALSDPAALTSSTTTLVAP